MTEFYDKCSLDATISPASSRHGDQIRRIMERLQCQLKKATAEVARLKRQQRRRSEHAESWRDDRPTLFRTMLVMQALGPTDSSAVKEFISSLHGNWKLKKNFETLHLSELLNEHIKAGRECVVSPKTMLGKRALSRAQKFLQERDLREWIRSVNLERGLAPKGKDIRAEFVRLTSSRQALGTRGGQCLSRHWYRRYSRRWALKTGKLPIGERLSSEEMEKKASSGDRSNSCPSLPRFEIGGCPVRGQIWSRKWNQFWPRRECL